MVLADLIAGSDPPPRKVAAASRVEHPHFEPILERDMLRLERGEDSIPGDFTEDKHGFYINGRQYGPTDPPLTTAAIGS